LTGGTRTYAAIGSIVAYDTGLILSGTLTSVTAVYTGCWHSHIYNWIAMPSMSAAGAVTSVVNGFGDAVVGYGYSMVGTATTDCTVSAIVTTDLFLTTGTEFVGGSYQNSVATVSSVDIPAIISILPVWGK
jgi:hypothetical protein